MAQILKILTDACTSHIVRGQSTLKDVTGQYFWKGLSHERSKAMKALYAVKAIKVLYALYALYADVLVEKRTLVKKKKQNHTTTTVRLKNKTLMDDNCL